MKREFDLIVFGATGFTGRLVAQYLLETHGVGGALTWAMAGRNPDKLAATRRDIGAPQALPLLQADASDPAALAALVSRAGAVLSTVGPYQLHGEPLVRACAQAGTDYVDLCGEPGWMARMIAQYDAPARASGARIVFSCGFDSIPFDLGVLFLQDEAMRRFGAPLTRVRGRVRVMKGTFSGGTIASALASIEAARRDRDLARVMADPFALTPGFRGPAQPEGDSAAYDDAAQSWTAPFVMAAINTKNVHRTNALRGHPWGRDFVYDERILTGEYKADFVLLAVAEVDKAGGVLNVSLAGIDPAGLVSWRRGYRIADGDVAYAMELAAVVTQGVLEGRWKVAKSEDGQGGGVAAGSGSEVYLAVAFSSPEEWDDLRRQILDTPGIDDVRIGSVSSRSAEVSLRYPGGGAGLASALARQGLVLSQGGGTWILRSGY